tara:strand:- start:163 stop:1071 length:909 start_codon:yes stop_codon:yes gene_type:complete
MNTTLLGLEYHDVRNFLNKEEPAFGFSLRDLNGKNNVCVRVRSTDGNKQDDFTPRQIANGELLTYVGDGFEGFVTRWYNQFDTTEFYEQSTTSVQPQIVIDQGGTAELVTSNQQPNEIPSIDFGGFGYVTNGFLVGDDYTPSQDLLIVAVVRPQAVDPSVDGFIFENFTSAGRGLLQDNFGSGTYTFINDTASTTPDRLRASVPDTNLTVLTARLKADAVTLANNQFEIYINGVLAASNNGVLLNYQARTGDTVIGAGSVTGSEPYKGRISEILIYRGNNLDYTQKVVEKNVMSYYSKDLNI